MSDQKRSHECDPRPRGRDLEKAERSHSCDLLLEDLREAMRETGHTAETIAAHRQIHRRYVERQLDAEKPLNADQIANLPPDVGKAFDRRRAERRGLIVVEPLSGLDAQKALVAGLIGVMSAPRLPAKADQMARGELRQHERGKAVNE
ncbi:MAG TPA: hypothetical protein VHZ73_08375 [Vicinamibacterales bacterium]|jgi:hypothetical protein|nr:hypothetical protein [Vicinamibacterales bacterium]